MVYYTMKKKKKKSFSSSIPSWGSVQYKGNKEKCTKQPDKKALDENMFKALANDVAGQMQKEIKSSNFCPTKYKLKN